MAKNKGFWYTKRDAGFQEILKSGACRQMIMGKAEKVASAAANHTDRDGAKFKADVKDGKLRAFARASSTNDQGYRAAIKDHALTIALGEAR